MATTFTCAAHEFVNGQTVIITDTTNYDGSYDLELVSDSVFNIDTDYYDIETGTAYPILDGDYYISFLIALEDIFNEVKLKTALKAKAGKDQYGNISDEIPLTEDRRELFLILLERASTEIFRKLQAYSRGIMNAYKFNTTVDLDGDGTAETTTKYIQFTINENKTYQDENIYPLMESKMKEIMVSFVLKEWYQIVSMAQDMKMNDYIYNEAVNEFKRLSMRAEGKKPITMNEGFR